MPERDLGDSSIELQGPEAIVAQARASCRVPGCLLLLSGLVGLLFFVSVLILAAVKPTAYLDFVIKMIDDFMPNGAPKDEMIEEQKLMARMYRLDLPSNLMGFSFGLLLNGIVVIGGWKMMKVRSFHWAVASSICCLFLISGSFCFGFIFGLWAIIVLMRKTTLQAFLQTEAD